MQSLWNGGDPEVEVISIPNVLVRAHLSFEFADGVITFMDAASEADAVILDDFYWVEGELEESLVEALNRSLKSASTSTVTRWRAWRSAFRARRPMSSSPRTSTVTADGMQRSPSGPVVKKLGPAKGPWARSGPPRLGGMTRSEPPQWPPPLRMSGGKACTQTTVSCPWPPG